MYFLAAENFDPVETRCDPTLGHVTPLTCVSFRQVCLLRRGH